MARASSARIYTARRRVEEGEREKRRRRGGTGGGAACNHGLGLLFLRSIISPESLNDCWILFNGLFVSSPIEAGKRLVVCLITEPGGTWLVAVGLAARSMGDAVMGLCCGMGS